MNKLFYQIALTQINGIGDVLARNLLDIVGDEEAIFRSSKKSLSTIKGISNRLVNEILNPNVFRLAEEELTFVEKNKIKTLFLTDSSYPVRMKECIDAPVLLYFKGDANLNTKHIISIVGTRKSTNYGNGFCESFIEEISNSLPNSLIVSGLAYGIDIQSHKASLKNNLPTIGVLAHGLDRIYPQSHRNVAIEMLEKGGLVTEFKSKTSPEKFNFVRRNRIIAGMSDAIVVVESDTKGGSLITADIGNSYNKEIFSVPGRITDLQSKGCNQLISENKAIIFHSTEKFLQHMNWMSKTMATPKQKELFLNLSTEEQKIYDALFNVDTLHINNLAIEIDTPVSQLFFTLLELEMKGVIQALPGGIYKIA